MACEQKYYTLMHDYLDGELTDEERQEFKDHLASCDQCRIHFEELSVIDSDLRQINTTPPHLFTDAVMDRIKDENKSNKRKFSGSWFRRHPLVSAAALFFIFMTGYIMSLWTNEPFSTELTGNGQVVIQNENRTVIVPEGEVIKGDLIVENGKVKIEGKVDGDVILVNSDKLLASAGSVTGEIEQVNQVLEWIWYHIKDIFN